MKKARPTGFWTYDYRLLKAVMTAWLETTDSKGGRQEDGLMKSMNGVTTHYQKLSDWQKQTSMEKDQRQHWFQRNFRDTKLREKMLRSIHENK